MKWQGQEFISKGCDVSLSISSSGFLESGVRSHLQQSLCHAQREGVRFAWLEWRAVSRAHSMEVLLYPLEIAKYTLSIEASI